MIILYSEKIKKQLSKNSIEVGDLVRVTSSKGEFTGLLMPRTNQGENDVIALKLSSGYNIGIKVETVELVEKKSQKPKEEPIEPPSETDGIAILGCGGTIVSKIEYRTGAAFPSITPDELRRSFPALAQYKVHSKVVFSLLSEDMNMTHWKIIADQVVKEIRSGSKGVVIMHGTDTIAYTAAALSFMIQNLPAPVVFVGAQRSGDRPSSENEMNLMNGVFSATKDFGHVGLCMHATGNDDYCLVHKGTKVRKMHTSRRDAFKSINSRPLFAVDYTKKRFDTLSDYKKRSPIGEMKYNAKLNDKVAMVYTHPGIKPELIAKLSDYDGIVLIGTGLGHVPTDPFGERKSVLSEVKSLIDSGVSVVMSPQTIAGRLCMRTYTAGRLLIDAGVIGDGADWLPETAYAKLCWVLGQTKDQKKVRELMMTNMAGEISQCTYVEETDLHETI